MPRKAQGVALRSWGGADVTSADVASSLMVRMMMMIVMFNDSAHYCYDNDGSMNY